jgi:hypothetical protein
MSLQNYLQDIEVFFARLGRLKGSGKFDLENDDFEVAQSTQLPCVAANRTGATLQPNSNFGTRASAQRWNH